MGDEVWCPKKPRFIVDTCEKCSDDRQFKNGEIVFNQRLGLAYSVEEIVEVLNQQGLFSDYFYELIQEKIWYCQAKYHKTDDEKYKIEEECLKKLREDTYSNSSIFKYSNYLKEYLENE